MYVGRHWRVKLKNVCVIFILMGMSFSCTWPHFLVKLFTSPLKHSGKKTVCDSLPPTNFWQWEILTIWLQRRNQSVFFFPIVHMLPISHTALWKDTNNLTTNNVTRAYFCLLLLSIWQPDNSRLWLRNGVSSRTRHCHVTWKEEMQLASNNVYF
jgi:hypothetical protein